MYFFEITDGATCWADLDGDRLTTEVDLRLKAFQFLEESALAAVQKKGGPGELRLVAKSDGGSILLHMTADFDERGLVSVRSGA